MALGTSYFPDSSRECWVNNYTGKKVQITLDLMGMADMPTLTGIIVRIDKFQYRYYLVLKQNEKMINVNIDHILTIEEK